MDAIRLEKVYAPTLSNTGPLVVVTNRRNPSTLQVVARPCRLVADILVKALLDYKKKALLITSAVLIKLTSVGKSILKYVKKDFLKKEGIPLKGLVIYKGGARGMGRIIGHSM